jgi:hypothetical protein
MLAPVMTFTSRIACAKIQATLLLALLGACAANLALVCAFL